MSLFVFQDAKDRLNFRLGHRTDITTGMLDSYVNQAQFTLATNIKGIEEFDRISGPCGLVIGQSQYQMSDFPGATNFWAITKVHNDTNRLLMQRGEWEQWLSMNTIPDGIPSMWVRSSAHFFIFQAPTEATSLTFYYRAYPTPGVLQIPDNWFDPLVDLSVYYALPDIGKGNAQEVVRAKLPGEVQLALQHPLRAMDWEAMHDPNLGAYPMTGGYHR